MNYYYLVASLPMLSVSGEVPFSVEHFMGQCRDFLSDDLYELLDGVKQIPGEKSCCETEKKWNAFETSLRNRAAHWVAHKTKADVTPFIREESEVFMTLEKQVEDAFDTDNPMEVEKALDKLRWYELDSLASGHDFDFDALFIYKIRLFILEKWSGLSKEAGQEQVENSVAAILKKSTETA